MPLILEGLQGKSVLVDGSSIRIIKKGGMFTSQREKSLPIRNISSVEVKKPGLTSGFIQFSIAGGKARDSSFTLTGGAFDAAQDENSVVFVGDAKYQVALQIKQHLEAQMLIPAAASQVSSFSPADEIVKLKALLDSGILTQEEFNSKKKQLLGL